MTLSTYIAVKGEVDPEELFQLTLLAVCLAANEPHRWSTAEIERSEPGQWREHHTINTRCGQGLAAWTFLHYNADGTPLHAEDAYEVDEADADDDPYFIAPACHSKINLDTAYGYRGDDGSDCSTLHARVIRLLHATLAAREISLSWKNEYTGEWHDGLDGLEEFVGNGVDAGNWFREVAMPAVKAHIALTQ